MNYELFTRVALNTDLAQYLAKIKFMLEER